MSHVGNVLFAHFGVPKSPMVRMHSSPSSQISVLHSLLNLPLPTLHHHHHRQGVQLTVTQQSLLDL